MKKSKKSLAVVLCLAMVITTLSACTSTGNTGGSDPKPTTTEAPQPTEVVTTTEVEPTEEPVVTEEPEVTAPVQEEDVIIRLTSRPFDISSKDAADLMDWEEFWMYFALVDAGTEYNGHTLYRIDALDTSEWTVPCYPDATQTCSFDVLFTDQVGEYTQVCYVVDGEYKLLSNFIPLFYNVTQGYLVGMDIHAEYANPEDALCYVSFDSDFGELLTIHLEDPSPYL